MLERAVKFFLKVILMVFALFGVRHILVRLGVFIPLEWFIVMIAGMMGFYGIFIIIMFSIMIYK